MSATGLLIEVSISCLLIGLGKHLIICPRNSLRPVPVMQDREFKRYSTLHVSRLVHHARSSQGGKNYTAEDGKSSVKEMI